MTFEEWKNNYVRSHENIDFDKIILEDMVEAWNAALLNLPTCDSCSYYEKASDIETYWHDCNNSKMDIKEWNWDEGIAEDVTPRVARDFGCILHSELEKK